MSFTGGVAAVRFGVLSPDTIRKMSVAQIQTPDTYDEDGVPIPTGVMDPRLGTLEPGQRCRTCGNTYLGCPGHFGHIELPVPVIHVGFVKIILKLLRSTCRSCGRILLSDDQASLYRAEIEALKKEDKPTAQVFYQLKQRAMAAGMCFHCGEKQLKLDIEKPTTIIEITDSGPVALSPNVVRARLERILDEDLVLLDVDPVESRPEWMVLQVLPVPPVYVRPSITLESGFRSEDDLTHKLVDILRVAQRLKENIAAGSPSPVVAELSDLLQYHLTTYFNNEALGTSPSTHRSGRILKTLAQRLKGKEGRFRLNLSGKRVDFSSRTVISPDPNIRIDEVGVPARMAQQLTVPVTVTSWNIENMRQYVRNGPDKYPGSRYVIRPDGKRIRLRFVSDLEELAASLEPGFVVERHLQDGDIVLFNRQPSLHRMSIMAHAVKVLPYKTFRLNLCVCVSPDTSIMVDGMNRSIEELRNCWKESRVNTFDWAGTRRMMVTPLKAFWGLKPNDYEVDCFRIVTRTGREIKATADHPFYTGRGLTPAVHVRPGDRAVIYPNNFPRYEEVDYEILSEEDIIRHAPRETYLRHTLEELRRRSLSTINLRNNPLAPILARVVAHIFGDGSLILAKDVGRVVFRGTEPDLEDIRKDLRTLGFEPEGIRSERHEVEIVDAGGRVRRFIGEGKSFEARSKPLAILLKALGTPAGDKVKGDYHIPKWIKHSPRYIQKEFLASYFGCELTKPALRKKHGTEFREPVFKISKITSKVEAGKRLAGELETLLEGFGVSVTDISASPGNIRKDGSETRMISIRLSSSLESILNLYGRVGYRYNREADALARLGYEYYRNKRMALRSRAEAFNLVKELVGKGVKVAEAARRAGVPYQTAYDWIRRKKKAGLPPSFPPFEKYVEENCRNLEGGLVYDVVKVAERTNLPYVYDVTTVAEGHNFVANEFLTGNCPPYNADFDGDEMNLHVPQSEEAQVEARVLLLVQNNILSPRFGGPIIGAIRDFITAMFLLTRKGTLLDKNETSLLLSSIEYDGDLPEPAVKEPEPRWSGKQIFSLILPEGFNHRFRSSYCAKCKTCLEEDCPYDQYVTIKNGQLLAGVIDRNAIGVERTNSILHRIALEYGFSAAKSFLDKVSRMATTYLGVRGFTFSLSDVHVPERTYRDISKMFSEMDQSFLSIMEKHQRGEIQRQPGETLQESLESAILSLLSESRNAAGTVVRKSVPEDSSSVIMSRTGARGTTLNIDQMIATVGQQAVRRERIQRGFGQRVLSFFERGDRSPRARGFIYNSFVTGLDPVEFFFHAVGGRDGLVDTAVRTQQSGYMQRRLINALESLYVEYDGTVRAADDDKIVQFKYGEDGVDPAKSYHGRSMSVDLLVQRAQADSKTAEPASEQYVEGHVDKIKDELPESLSQPLVKSLLKSKASRAVVRTALKQAVEDYRESTVEPGDPVGIVTAQSIGEPGTQMTLRTFHFAGVREQSILLGLPRLIEIVDARKTPSTPQMRIYLDSEHRRNRAKAESLAKQLTYVTMREIASECAIDLDKNAVLLRLNDELMQEREISMEKVKEALQKYHTEIRGRNVYLTPPETSLEALEKVRDKVLLQRVRGMRRIARTMLTRESGEYVIYTEGSNLKEVVQTPGVDATRVETNDVQEIASVLGIEAARRAIINEARQVLREQGMDVDIRHLLLLADVMTASGKEKQVGRHGVVKLKSSVLARAAFEISVQTLLDAAAKGELDPLRGNVERILVGKEIPVGTGMVNMLMSPPAEVTPAEPEG